MVIKLEAALVEPLHLDHAAPQKETVRIMVAIKPVLVLGEDVSIADGGQDVDRKYLSYGTSEWDETALEEALRKAGSISSADVVVVSVGPPAADPVIRKALSKGANRAVRVWGECLVNADPILTARAIAGIAKLERPDLILTGAQSSDLAHGATGSALARILNIPCAAIVSELVWDGGSSVGVVRELEGGVQHSQRVPLPAVFTVQTGINVPRHASLLMVRQGKNRPLTLVEVSDHQADLTSEVRRVYFPERPKAVMLSGTADEVASRIDALVRQQGA